MTRTNKAPTDAELDDAASWIRARLESMLANLPESDPNHMPIDKLEQTRRWDQSHKDVSARRRADMRREGGRPRSRKLAGKTATFLHQRFERVV